MAIISPSPFRACAPAEEYFDYPLYFPKPNYRGRPAPAEDEELDSAAVQAASAAESERLRKEEELARVAPKPNVQKEKFLEISGGSPTISAQKAGDLARLLGFAPSQADIAALYGKHGDSVSFEQFQEWEKERCVPHKLGDTLSELVMFFKEFDREGTGFLSCTQVKVLLSNYGEALTAQEVDVIFNELGITGDKVDYTRLVQMLLAAEE